MKKVKVNLGCGEDYKEGYLNVDCDPSLKSDICSDLNMGLPFMNNSVDEIYCKNMLEHIPNPLGFMLEIRRVLTHKGVATIITSNASYIIYHFPRKKAYHDTYNEEHSKEDQHYFLFQKGHLSSLVEKSSLKLDSIEYYISNTNEGRDRNFQKFLGAVIGKKFGYSDILFVVHKEDEDG